MHEWIRCHKKKFCLFVCFCLKKNIQIFSNTFYCILWCSPLYLLAMVVGVLCPSTSWKTDFSFVHGSLSIFLHTDLPLRTQRKCIILYNLFWIITMKAFLHKKKISQWHMVEFERWAHFSIHNNVFRWQIIFFQLIWYLTEHGNSGSHCFHCYEGFLKPIVY